MMMVRGRRRTNHAQRQLLRPDYQMVPSDEKFFEYSTQSAFVGQLVNAPMIITLPAIITVLVLGVIFLVGCNHSEPFLTSLDDSDVRKAFSTHCEEKHSILEQKYARLQYTWLDSQRRADSNASVAHGERVPSEYEVTTRVTNVGDYYVLERQLPQTGRKFIACSNPMYTFSLSSFSEGPWALDHVGSPGESLKVHDVVFGCIPHGHRVSKRLHDEQVRFKSFETCEFGGRQCFKLNAEFLDDRPMVLDVYFADGKYGECVAVTAWFENGTIRVDIHLEYDYSNEVPLVQSVRYVSPKAIRQTSMSDYNSTPDFSPDICFLSHYGFPEPKQPKLTWVKNWRVYLPCAVIVFALVGLWIIRRRR